VVDFLASAPHYREHLSAVRDALPPEARGEYVVPGQSGPDNPVLVASFGDLKDAEEMGRSRIAIMEHGAGQSYGGRGLAHGSYAGGTNRDAASLFLHPGPHPAARDRKAYPAARVEVVGSPHLDTLPHREGPAARVVAFSFHFNGPLCPETRNAYPAFFPAIVGLADKYEMLGHGHPKMWAMGLPGQRLANRYRKFGIEPVESFAEVCRRADVYVCDNSSTLFAFAATGRPVVVLNPPWYDRRVNHGLRFWEAAGVGVNCDRPEALGECIEEALRDTPERQQAREDALSLVYAYRSGASQRAADVLMDWVAA
jgi:hypothetical protein